MVNKKWKWVEIPFDFTGLDLVKGIALKGAYIGQTKKGLPSGVGTLIDFTVPDPQLTTYAGENRFHSVYTGHFLHGKRSGKGTEYNNDGSKRT